MNKSMMKSLLCPCLVLLLSHCSSAPKPPHCHDHGKGLKPVNTTPVDISSEVKHD